MRALGWKEKWHHRCQSWWCRALLQSCFWLGMESSRAPTYVFGPVEPACPAARVITGRSSRGLVLSGRPCKVISPFSLPQRMRKKRRSPVMERRENNACVSQLQKMYRISLVFSKKVFLLKKSVSFASCREPGKVWHLSSPLLMQTRTHRSRGSCEPTRTGGGAGGAALCGSHWVLRRQRTVVLRSSVSSSCAYYYYQGLKAWKATYSTRPRRLWPSPCLRTPTRIKQ